MKKLFLLIVPQLLFISLSISQSDWKLEKEESGIKIYTRKISGSSYKEFKGEVIYNTNLNTMCAIFDDAQNAKKWIHNCEESKRLKKINEFEGYCYYVQKLPWPMTNRDLITKYKITQDVKSKIVIIKLKGEKNYIPETDNVRVSKLEGFWLLIPQNKNEVKIIYQVHNEPGGSIPSYIANSAVVDSPFYTLKNLKNMLNQNIYKNKKFKEIIEF